MENLNDNFKNALLLKPKTVAEAMDNIREIMSYRNIKGVSVEFIEACNKKIDSNTCVIKNIVNQLFSVQD